MASVAERDGAVADMHDTLDRYVELRLARDLVADAVRVVREEHQVPLVLAAGASFSRLTLGEFDGLAADVDGRGEPEVVGVRSVGRGTQTVSTMSEGTRDAMFLAFRLAAVSSYCAHAEPLPILLDDVLVQFGDARTDAALEVLADVGRGRQVLLFTHNRSVAAAAARAAASGRSVVVSLDA